MKINMVDLMLIDFDTLERIYKDMKKKPKGLVEHYQFDTFSMQPKVLQVIKLKEGSSK